MFLLTTLLIVASQCCRSFSECSGTEDFLVTVRFDWSQETDSSFPIDVPYVGFRHFFCVTHNASYQFWTVAGQIAPYLIDYIIDYRGGSDDGTIIGNLTEALEREKRFNSIADFEKTEKDTLEPTESFNLTITADSRTKQTLLSCFSLVRPSDDWFVGVALIDLCNRSVTSNGDSVGSGWGTGPDVFRIYSFDAGIYDSDGYDSTGELEPMNPPSAVRRLRIMAAEGYGTFNVTALGSNSSPSNQEGRSGPACFPSGETVTLSTGFQVPIENIELGQHVLLPRAGHSNPPVSSSVFAFSHRDPTAFSTFLNITFVSSESIVRHLRVSKGHYIYVYDRKSQVSLSAPSKTIDLIPATRVRPGDYLVGATGEKMLVSAVGEILARGLYNPHTIHGDLIVSNVRVSCYTTAVRPTTASILLAPLRFFSRIGMHRMSNMFALTIAQVASSNSRVLSALQHLRAFFNTAR